ncbi:hypothetical protein HUG10_11510 [Halorarum halophilum]|uniref:Uncharacterized protein n=1 Tax=Halorarum halophilum TaxID=2743090 RepID=A0A7D5KEC0_9EURY|nr:hypothetical protein [Halobaculum halophilum]QLG28137.1 hypothetical protein HUG10_11510 [Halobaculum halophilum]
MFEIVVVVVVEVKEDEATTRIPERVEEPVYLGPAVLHYLRTALVTSPAV